MSIELPVISVVICVCATCSWCPVYKTSPYLDLCSTDYIQLKFNYIHIGPAFPFIFQMMVRVDTAPTGPGGAIEVAWVGASFGVLPANGKHYAMNYRISLTQGLVEVRSRGSDVSQPLFSRVAHNYS